MAGGSRLNLLTTEVRELYDTIANFGGRSDPDYDIVVRQAGLSNPANLPDGAFYAYVKSVRNGRLTFDVVQWFTGAAAAAACREDGVSSDQDELCNDYYIRNDNPLLRTLSLSHAALRMPAAPGGFGNQPTTQAALARRVAMLGGDFLAKISMRHGGITTVEFVYRP